MNSSVYERDSCSRLEAAWNNLDTTEVAFLATHYVNPIWNNLVGKTIIITLPTNLDLERLVKYNKVISRYPLKVNDASSYELVPYSDVEFTYKAYKGYSRKILNKYLLTSEHYNVKEDGRYLLGTEPETNGYLNTIGYLLLKTIKS